jgi:micrococcal nuclease
VFPYLYQALVEGFTEDDLLVVLLDLGFHVRTRRRLQAPDPEHRQRMVHRRFPALVMHTEEGLHDIRLLIGLDGEPQLPAEGEGPPELWRYPARIRNVLDPDTMDADINIGFDVMVHQRLRLSGIQAPERGRSNRHAMGYLFRRLRENRFRAQIVSSRHGKWRRWLADIYFPDSDRSLNDELVERGYAHYWDGRSPKTPGFSRMIMELPDQTRGRLSDLAATEGIAPGQVAGRIVSDYFDGDATGDGD